MTASFQISELRAGDVLLYHGTSFVSDMIRLFDGSEYSHASIYDGSNVAEALAQGVVSDPVGESIKDSKFVDVFRFRSSTGQGLDDPTSPRFSVARSFRVRS